LVLHARGVSGDPPPPGASAARLGASSLGPAWEGGAIAPLTCRGLVGLLLASLPADARAQVGQFLLASAGPAADASQPTYEALLELHRLAHPALDTSPGRPVVGLNLNAPQRAVTQAVEELVRQLKREQGLGERRRRDDKLDGYLSAWDLREGWAGDHYDGSREQTLREIARQQRLPLSTVAHHYRTAFRLIVGREYTPERWARVMGAGKLYAWLDPHEVPRRTLRRPWRNRQPRPVPEAALAPPAAEGPSHFLDTAGISADELA
jgi:hypothetical protein